LQFPLKKNEFEEKPKKQKKMIIIDCINPNLDNSNHSDRNSFLETIDYEIPTVNRQCHKIFAYSFSRHA
jgi:hypothetical protein